MMVRLSELVRSTGDRAGADVSLPVYSVTKHRGFVPSLEYFSKRVFGKDLQRYKVVEPGQFAYATIHLDEGSIGIAPERALVSPMYTVFQADERRVELRYLLRYLKSPAALVQYPKFGNGTAERRKSIPLSALGRLEVPLPPLPEQRRIAAILDHADALRQKRYEQLAFLDEATRRQVQSILDRALEFRSLKDLLAEPLRNGVSPSRSGTIEQRVLTLSAITRGRFDPSQSKIDQFAKLPADDKWARRGMILVCRGNGNAELVGRMVAVDAIEGDVIFPDTMIASRVSSRISIPTLLAAWRTDAVRTQIRAGARTTNGTYKINQQSLGGVLVPVPSAEDQARIDAIDRERAVTRAALSASANGLDALFASIQHRAFRGEP
ncbi:MULTISPECIES: restriction endonuclease subunit S [unclassified Microbacterium]|uniref:restriction endonuclease subunit S n=1 Tax=unclassified Microbacterium TaxID=2609290 RepID=UPI00364A43AC